VYCFEWRSVQPNPYYWDGRCYCKWVGKKEITPFLDKVRATQMKELENAFTIPIFLNEIKPLKQLRNKRISIDNFGKQIK